MPADKDQIGLKTVALNWVQYNRLAEYKAENRCRSFNAAIKHLLDAAERDQGAHPCDGCDWWSGCFCECPPARPCPREEAP